MNESKEWISLCKFANAKSRYIYYFEENESGLRANWKGQVKPTIDRKLMNYSRKIKVHHIKKFYSAPTHEKAWKLEEIIYQKFGRSPSFIKDEGDNKLIAVYPNILEVRISGYTREQGLFALITEINWTNEEKEQLKDIIEGSIAWK